MRISNIIIQPVVTEKSMEMQNENKYVFKVNKKASKGAVAKELKRIYGVDAVEVYTMIMPGKRKRIPKTRFFTKTSKWKKAIVKLEEGQKLDLVAS